MIVPANNTNLALRLSFNSEKKRSSFSPFCVLNSFFIHISYRQQVRPLFHSDSASPPVAKSVLLSIWRLLGVCYLSGHVRTCVMGDEVNTRRDTAWCSQQVQLEGDRWSSVSHRGPRGLRKLSKLISVRFNERFYLLPQHLWCVQARQIKHVNQTSCEMSSVFTPQAPSFTARRS